MGTFPKRKRKADPKSVGKVVRASGSGSDRKLKRKTVVKEEPPYKVLFPGYRERSTSPYKLRELKDPRLGEQQRIREAYFKSCRNFGDYDGTSEVGSDCESEAEDYSRAEQHKQYQKWLYRESVKNESRYLKEQDCKCAEEAVKFYNKKHGTEYEILETLGSYRRLAIGHWYHCNFRAECKSGAGPPKLFFAELNRTAPEEYDVIDCMILDDPGHCVNTVYGCKMCPGPLLHPVDGFKVGK